MIYINEINAAGKIAADDTILVKNVPATAGSKMLENFKPLFSAEAVERLEKAGGNVHYERFIDEVVSGIKSGKEFSYHIFSCKKGDFDGTNIINPRKPIIIEGAYALHPEIPDIYDLKIFLDADTETRLERIRKRNGADALEIFKTK